MSRHSSAHCRTAHRVAEPVSGPKLRAWCAPLAVEQQPIRTPDQRLRVFVSSTLGELANERVAARRAIEALHLTPVMFELGARPHPARALYRAYLDQSHVFLGIYWERYGWVAPDETVSGLEDEYLLSGSLPRLVYLKAPAPEREPRLRELIDRIQADDTVAYKRFEDIDEIERLITEDLAVLLSERFLEPDDDAHPASTAWGVRLPAGVADRRPRRGAVRAVPRSWSTRACTSSRSSDQAESARHGSRSSWPARSRRDSSTAR